MTLFAAMSYYLIMKLTKLLNMINLFRYFYNLYYFKTLTKIKILKILGYNDADNFFKKGINKALTIVENIG